MQFVLGRREGREDDAPVGNLGSFRALDGSDGAALSLDLDGPHAVVIVGKRGYGKSYTMGVLAEELARTPAIAPVIIDPMGVFDGLTAPADGDPVPAAVISEPTVTPDSLDPQSWCSLLGLPPDSGAGGLVWQAGASATTLPAMVESIESADAPRPDRRAARNHIELASSWGVFDAAGIDATRLASGDATVLDISGLDDAAMNAVVRGVAEALYRARINERIKRLPWLLIDEAHTFFQGVARGALHRVLTRGRAPGISIGLATQRPSALSDISISQSDILIAHRLTARDDLAALEAVQPTYMEMGLEDRLPTAPGEAVVVDDAAEAVQHAQIRPRDTPHGGKSPSASDRIAATEEAE